MSHKTKSANNEIKDKFGFRDPKNWIWSILFAFIIGFSSGIIGTMTLNKLNEVSIIKHYEQTVEKLTKLNDSKDWAQLNEELVAIKGKDSLSDVYNYFSGRLYMYNPSLSINGPEEYFYNVKGDSKFFRFAQQDLIFYCLNKYLENSDQQISAFNKIANNIANKGTMVYFYYFAKLMPITNRSFKEINDLYLEFKKQYSSVKDFSKVNVYYTNIDSDDSILGSIALDFMFNINLLLAARRESLDYGEYKERLKEIAINIDKIQMKLIMRNLFNTKEVFIDDAYNIVDLYCK